MSDSLWPHGLYSARFLCPWRYSKEEHWSSLPCPPPGDIPNPGIKARCPALQADCFTIWATREALQETNVFWFHVCSHHLQWFWRPRKYTVAVSIVSTSIYHEVMGPDAMIFIFWMLSFKPAFSLSSFTFIKRLFSSSLLSAIRVVSSVYLR